MSYLSPDLALSPPAQQQLTGDATHPPMKTPGIAPVRARRRTTNALCWRMPERSTSSSSYRRSRAAQGRRLRQRAFTTEFRSSSSAVARDVPFRWVAHCVHRRVGDDADVRRSPQREIAGPARPCRKSGFGVSQPFARRLSQSSTRGALPTAHWFPAHSLSANVRGGLQYCTVVRAAILPSPPPLLQSLAGSFEGERRTVRYDIGVCESLDPILILAWILSSIRAGHDNPHRDERSERDTIPFSARPPRGSARPVAPSRR